MTRLLDAGPEVFAEALTAGGTSFDSLYVNVNGQSGYFERSLAVYGRAGQPCPRCGTPVRRDAFMNRSRPVQSAPGLPAGARGHVPASAAVATRRRARAIG